VREDVPTTVSRPSIKYIADNLSKLNNDEAMAVGTHAVDKLI
jgi:hypothetical protein